MVNASANGVLYHAGKVLVGGVAGSKVTIVDGVITTTGGIVLPAGAISSAMLAAGAAATNIGAGGVTTTMLAASAAQAPLGSYVAIPTFASTTTATWLATPVAATVTTGGGLLRVDCSTVLHHSVLAAQYYTAVGVDGTVNNAMSYTLSPGAGYDVSVGWTYYLTLAAGSHTIALFVYLATAGTLTLNNGLNHTLFVTEQKR